MLELSDSRMLLLGTWLDRFAIQPIEEYAENPIVWVFKISHDQGMQQIARQQTTPTLLCSSRSGLQAWRIWRNRFTFCSIILHTFVSLVSCRETCTADPGSCPKVPSRTNHRQQAWWARTWLRLVPDKDWQELLTFINYYLLFQIHIETI